MGSNLCCDHSRNKALFCDLSFEESDDPSGEDFNPFKNRVQNQQVHTTSSPKMELIKLPETLMRSSDSELPCFRRNCQSAPCRYNTERSTLRRPRINEKYDVEPSLAEKIQQYKCRSVGAIRGEQHARSYCDALENNTLEELDRTFQMATSIVQKGADIDEELKRQDKLIEQASEDIHASGEIVSETNWRLRGMESWGGKAANLIWRKKPRTPNVYPEYLSTYSGLQIVRNVPGSQGSSRTSSPRSTNSKQSQIKEKVNQISSTLDLIESQQVSFGDILHHQEEGLSTFESHMERFDDKLQKQTVLVRKIVKNN